MKETSSGKHTEEPFLNSDKMISSSQGETTSSSVPPSAPNLWHRIWCMCVHVHAHTQLHLTLCNSLDCGPLGFWKFAGQEYWIGLPFPSSRNLLDPGIKTLFSEFPALADRFLNTSATWEAQSLHKGPYLLNGV